MEFTNKNTQQRNNMRASRNLWKKALFRIIYLPLCSEFQNQSSPCRLIHAHKWKMRFATAHLCIWRRQWQKSECERARSCERGIIARHYFRNFILAEVDVWRSARFERRGPSLLTDSEGLLYLSLVRVCVCNSIWAHRRRLHGGSFSHSLETPLSAAARI